MGRIISLLPGGAAIWAALAAAAGAVIAWVARNARREAEASAQKEDQDHAEILQDRVSRNRADRDRLRPFDGSGWRD